MAAKPATVEQIQALHDQQENFASSWNGDNSTFYHEGEKYSEDDAHHAAEIAEVCEKLLELLEDIA